MLSNIALATAASGAVLYAAEKSKRRTHSMEGGLHRDIALPHGEPFELWHNALSLCSKKVRMCLDELGIAYASHHVDLIETGSYETLSRRFLAVNPAGLVPVLVHEGHPVYESHEIIRYAAEHSTTGASLLPSSADDRRVMDEWIRRSSLTGDDPAKAAAESAGNCVPGLTIPLFAAMIAHVPATKIVEGLLFHRLRQRPAGFLVLKMAGLARIPDLAPAMKVIRTSRAHMQRHLHDLEAHLAQRAAQAPDAGGPWIAGPAPTLADISWAVILERLREAEWEQILQDPARPHLADWWLRIRARPSYRSAMLGSFEHPLVLEGRRAIRDLKHADPRFCREVYGEP